MDPALPLGGVGRGLPMDMSRPPPSVRKVEMGLYGVDCDFARKQRREDARMKSKDEDRRRGKTVLNQALQDQFEGLGFSSDESGRRKHGSGHDGRGPFSVTRGSREQRVRFGGIHGAQFDSDHPSLDTSGDEGVPQFGGRRDRRRGPKGKDRDDRPKRGDYEPRHEREDRRPLRWGEKFERPMLEEREVDNSPQKRHERVIDYLRLRRDDREGDRFHRYEDEVDSDRGRHHGRGSGRGGRGYGERSSGAISMPDRACFNCGEYGHISRDCPEPRKPPKTIICYSCKKEGHISRNCPEKLNADIFECTNANLNATSIKDPLDFPPLQLLDRTADSASDMNGCTTPQRKELIAAEQDVVLVYIGTEEMGEVVDSVTVELDGTEVKHEIVEVDQLFKKDTVQRLLMRGGENYKDDAVCECKKKAGFFAECKCKKKVVIVANRQTTVECIRIGLGICGVTVASVHCGMDQYDRDRNLAWFKFGRYPILVVMASEAASCAQTLKEADWLLNVDLPLKVDEYTTRIEMVRCEGKPLLVTSFYDELMDNPLAQDLAMILNDAGETVPECLSCDRAGGGGLESETVDENDDGN